MSTWSNDEVIHWLKSNGFKKYTRKFQEQQIDGRRFLRLTDEDIVLFLTRSNDDGSEERSTIGAQTRFRTKLNQLKQIDAEEQRKKATEDIPSTNISEVTEIPSNEEKKHRSKNFVRQYNYLVDQENHLKFFQNPKFVQYFLNYLKKATIPMDIKLIKNQSNDDEFSPSSYTIQFNGTKRELRTVRNFLRNLFQSIETKEFQGPIVKHWMRCSTAKSIIQHLFDSQTSLWTICDLHGMIHSTLKITFFNDEKFNGTSPVPLIDEIIEKQISVETILITINRSTILLEYLNLNTMKIVWKETICRTESYENEYQRILDFYQNNNPSLISIIEERMREKSALRIFGDGKLITKLLRELEDLFKKHRRQKFPFTQLSSVEVECLFQLCHEELKEMEAERDNCWLKFDWNKSFFYAPEYVKDQIESRMKQLFTDLKRRIIKTEEFYYNSYQQIESQIKILSKKYQCYSIIKRKSKLKSFPIIKSSTNPLNIDSSSSSPAVICQAAFPNGSIETSIGNIVRQQADVMIIPSFSCGLREHLIQSAGEIRETGQSHPTEHLPFITETTAGNLKCRKILFVNWSLPKQTTSEESLISSIQFFLSRVFQHLIKEDKSSHENIRSIAMAMPEIFHDEQIFSEEFLNEMINQIHSNESSAFRISLIFLSNQEKFYQNFTDTLQLYQNTGNTYGIFFCPSTVLSITLWSLETENIERCEKILERYLKRSMCTQQLNGFDHWNQSLISQFYSLAQQRSVLPKMNDHQQQVILYGSIVNVAQVYHQYQLINVSIQIRRNFIDKTSYPNIMLHYSTNDSMMGERLFNRLTNDGFLVTRQSDFAAENLIVFCISDHALDDDQFREVLMSAKESGKQLLPIQIEPYRTTRWLRRLIGNQCVLRLFGSDEYFNLQYQKLVLKIFQLFNVEQTEEDLLKTIENDSLLHFLLTIEQRKSIYEEKMKKLCQIDKNQFSRKERENFLLLMEETINDEDIFPESYLNSFFLQHLAEDSDGQQRFYRMKEQIREQIETSSLRNWIDQFLQQSTKQNLPPYSPTGDLNDAVFPVSTMISSNLPLATLFGAQFWCFYDVEEPTKESRIVTPKEEPTKESRIVTLNEESTTRNQATKEKVKKRPPSYSRSTRNRRGVTKTESTLPISRGKKTNKEHPSAPRVDTVTRNAKCQSMVDELKKSFANFQRLCNEYQPRTKEPIQQDVKAIFTPSPFDNTNIQYRNALRIRPQMNLPLKFIWNGVCEMEERKSKRNDASVFFFFEPVLASESQQ